MLTRRSVTCGTTVQVRGTARGERGLTDSKFHARHRPNGNPLGAPGSSRFALFGTVKIILPRADPPAVALGYRPLCRPTTVHSRTFSHKSTVPLSRPSRRLEVNRFDYRDSKPRSNRRSSRVAELAAGGLIGAVALAGCSAGQLSQTASQESAVDGNQAVINNVALRNVHIQAQQNSDFLHPGATVDLVLVVVNQSPDVTDKLVGISTDIGKVTVTGDPTLPVSGTLFVGTPNGMKKK